MCREWTRRIEPPLCAVIPPASRAFFHADTAQLSEPIAICVFLSSFTFISTWQTPSTEQRVLWAAASAGMVGFGRRLAAEAYPEWREVGSSTHRSL